MGFHAEVQINRRRGTQGSSRAKQQQRNSLAPLRDKEQGLACASPFYFPVRVRTGCAVTRTRETMQSGDRHWRTAWIQSGRSPARAFCSVNRRSHRAVPLRLSYLLVPESPDDPEPDDPDVPELLPVPPLLLLEPLPVPPELLPEPEVPEPEVPLELEPLPPILEPLPVPPVALLLVFVFFFELLLPEPAEPLEPLPVAPLLLEPLLPDVPLEGVFWAIACAARNAAAAIIKPSRFILLCCLLVLARRIKPGGLLFVRCAWAHQAAGAPPPPTTSAAGNCGFYFLSLLHLARCELIASASCEFHCNS